MVTRARIVLVPRMAVMMLIEMAMLIELMAMRVDGDAAWGQRGLAGSRLQYNQNNDQLEISRLLQNLHKRKQPKKQRVQHTAQNAHGTQHNSYKIQHKAGQIRTQFYLLWTTSQGLG